ncbi:hypothetical protein E3O25_06175 [Cryobacterium sp. TMT1-3]|uniref:hypothetical protein n=1 Tax=Cryobacterium sp. TMT1-3 TaxID=1259237 RepID=UPI00106BDC05|nr:hypothetical protein [Cryobacterium sp. TMT1-3]TFC28783.1 hypothetical protein E3O25_06175 [Cryobacterium sp. TMT1-3]
MTNLDPAKFVVSKDAVVSDIDLDREEFILDDGRRLTDKVAAEIAADALAKARRRNLVPGRKSLGRDGKHSPVVQFRLAEDDLDYISRAAAQNGQTISAFARQAVLSAAGKAAPDVKPR